MTLDVDRLAAALGRVGHDEALHRWCKDVDGCGLYSDGREFSASIAREYERLGTGPADGSDANTGTVPAGDVEPSAGVPRPREDMDAIRDRGYAAGRASVRSPRAR